MPRTIKIVLPDPVTNKTPPADRLEAGALAFRAVEAAAKAFNDAIHAAGSVGCEVRVSGDYLRNTAEAYVRRGSDRLDVNLSEGMERLWQEQQAAEDAEKERRKAEREAKKAAKEAATITT